MPKPGNMIDNLELTVVLLTPGAGYTDTAAEFVSSHSYVR